MYTKVFFMEKINRFELYIYIHMYMIWKTFIQPTAE